MNSKLSYAKQTGIGAANIKFEGKRTSFKYFIVKRLKHQIFVDEVDEDLGLYTWVDMRGYNGNILRYKINIDTLEKVKVNPMNYTEEANKWWRYYNLPIADEIRIFYEEERRKRRRKKKEEEEERRKKEETRARRRKKPDRFKPCSHVADSHWTKNLSSDNNLNYNENEYYKKIFSEAGVNMRAMKQKKYNQTYEPILSIRCRGMKAKRDKNGNLMGGYEY